MKDVGNRSQYSLNLCHLRTGRDVHASQTSPVLIFPMDACGTIPATFLIVGGTP
jgi:hypothetical protein